MGEDRLFLKDQLAQILYSKVRRDGSMLSMIRNRMIRRSSQVHLLRSDRKIVVLRFWAYQHLDRVVYPLVCLQDLSAILSSIYQLTNILPHGLKRGEGNLINLIIAYLKI